MLREVCAAPASGSSVIRRALAVYVRHLEGIIADPSRAGTEMREVLRSNEGDSASIPEDVLLAVPVSKFTDICIDCFAAPRSPAEMIQEDLDRWAKEQAAGLPLSPSVMSPMKARHE
jgi:hypothetical protein